MSVLEIKKQIAELSPAEVEEVAEWTAALRKQADREALNRAIADSFAGRVTPLHISDARMRAKYNIPDNVEPFTPEELAAFEREMDALL